MYKERLKTYSKEELEQKALEIRESIKKCDKIVNDAKYELLLIYEIHKDLMDKDI